MCHQEGCHLLLLGPSISVEDNDSVSLAAPHKRHVHLIVPVHPGPRGQSGPPPGVPALLLGCQPPTDMRSHEAPQEASGGSGYARRQQLVCGDVGKGVVGKKRP